jgi:hypothetical protein
MKAIIEFNLDDADDRNSYEVHNKAKDMAYILWNLMTNKRTELENRLEHHKKYDKFKTLNLVFEEISEMLEEENINIHKLVQ